MKLDRIPDIQGAEEHFHGYLHLYSQQKRSHPWVWATVTCHRREIIIFFPTPGCDKSHHMKAQVKNPIIIFFSSPITLGYSFILFIYYSSVSNLIENTTSYSMEGERSATSLPIFRFLKAKTYFDSIKRKMRFRVKEAELGLSHV